mmetsp:Transcript_67003/g.172550  ORF Transcript_67003/g.172550 Transcript_67003/m.172550 type:complete len:228 (-) Transcript_67003:261-944(-)
MVDENQVGACHCHEGQLRIKDVAAIGLQAHEPLCVHNEQGLPASFHEGAVEAPCASAGRGGEAAAEQVVQQCALCRALNADHRDDAELWRGVMRPKVLEHLNEEVPSTLQRRAEEQLHRAVEMPCPIAIKLLQSCWVRQLRRRMEALRLQLGAEVANCRNLLPEAIQRDVELLQYLLCLGQPFGDLRHLRLMGSFLLALVLLAQAQALVKQLPAMCNQGLHPWLPPR